MGGLGLVYYMKAPLACHTRRTVCFLWHLAELYNRLRTIGWIRRYE